MPAWSILLTWRKVHSLIYLNLEIGFAGTWHVADESQRNGVLSLDVERHGPANRGYPLELIQH